MNWIPILLISLSEVHFFINCGPISNKPRNSGRSSGSSSFNTRRRDIYSPPNSQPIIDSSNYNNRDQKIVFEENDKETAAAPRERVILPDLDSKGRPTCLHSPDDTFCENVTNYPNTTIKKELEFSKEEFLEIFGTKYIEGKKSYIDDDLNEQRVCRRTLRVITPQMAKNQHNQWIYVVNDVEYTQAVVAEICEKGDRSCSYLEENLPPGMYSRCRQKYSYKRLLALHPSEKRTYSDKFKFPSCCACYVKSNDILSRTIKSKTKRKN